MLRSLLAIDAQGEIQVMWRNVMAGSRDLYLTHSRDGVHFSAAEKLGNGTWKLDACPMDGGGLAVDHGSLVSAWRRGNEIYLDRPGQPERALGEGRDVAITGGSHGAYVMWAGEKGLQLLTPGATSTVAVAPAGGYPNLVALPDGSVVAAWEDAGTIHTQRLH